MDPHRDLELGDPVGGHYWCQSGPFTKAKRVHLESKNGSKDHKNKQKCLLTRLEGVKHSFLSLPGEF